MTPIDRGLAPRRVAWVLVGIALSGCQRGDPPTARSPAAATAAPAPAEVDGAATPSASLAGVVHDADVDPASRRDPFTLPGPLAADTEPAGLRRIYGAQNVAEGEVPGAEGEMFHGVILFPGDPTRRAYLYFQDARTLTRLSMVRVFDPASRWTLDDGTGIGTPLSQVLRRNGKPIRFTGLGWDYGGTVTDWNDGRLAPRDDDPVRRFIRLGARDGVDPDDLPLGDSEHTSDDPRYPGLGDNVVVDEIGVSFPGEDDL